LRAWRSSAPAAASAPTATTHDLGAASEDAGRITRVEGEQRRESYSIIATVEGDGPFAGRRARLTIKNETMLLEVDDEPRAVFPDLVLL
jgi:DUF917 family protein